MRKGEACRRLEFHRRADAGPSGPSRHRPRIDATGILRRLPGSITDGTLDWCSETAAACLAWSPLGGGRLADGGARNAQEERVSATLNAMADKYSVSTAVTALAFVLKHQANIIPIIGTQTPARIREAAAAAQLEISARDFYDIIEAWRGVPMP
ncbi:MAG: aldo/keto reductase [Hyphomonas sp.]